MFKAELKDEDGSLFVLRDLELDTVNPCVGLNLSVTTDARRKAESLKFILDVRIKGYSFLK
jgi:hypothetical protein